MLCSEAQHEAIAPLRSAGLSRSLVAMTTGLLPADGEDFEMAIEYTHANLKHHRFVDMLTCVDGFRVREVYMHLLEKLERNSELSRARALRSLLGALCVQSSNNDNAWTWSSSHAHVKNGMSALITLYWLCNSAQMVRKRPHATGGMPSSLHRIEAVAKVSAAATHHMAWLEQGTETQSWGFSDAEEDDVAERAARLAEGAAGPLAADTVKGIVEQQAKGSAKGSAKGKSSPSKFGFEELRRTNPGSVQSLTLRPMSVACSIGRPPRQLRLNAILIGNLQINLGAFGSRPRAGHIYTLPDDPLSYPTLHSVPNGFEVCPTYPFLHADAEAERLRELRLLRETLRTFVCVDVTEWLVMIKPSAKEGVDRKSSELRRMAMAAVATVAFTRLPSNAAELTMRRISQSGRQLSGLLLLWSSFR